MSCFYKVILIFLSKPKNFGKSKSNLKVFPGELDRWIPLVGRRWRLPVDETSLIIWYNPIVNPEKSSPGEKKNIVYTTIVNLEYFVVFHVIGNTEMKISETVCWLNFWNLAIDFNIN